MTIRIAETSPLFWGAHAPSRIGFGALAETLAMAADSGGDQPCTTLQRAGRKVRSGGDATASTRKRVRSPEDAERYSQEMAAPSYLIHMHTYSVAQIRTIYGGT